MKFVICGNYGAGNLGDEMILKGLIKLLKKVSFRPRITVLSATPKETASLHKVKSVRKFPAGIKSSINWLLTKKGETSRAVRNCDYFILGGGGLFGGPEKKANIIWGIQAMMAYHYEKPVIILGQSIGKIDSDFEKWIIKGVFENADFISVRDEQSEKILKKIGVKKKIHVSPDLAFNCKLKKKAKPKTLLLALRQMPNLTNKFKKEIADFLKALVKKRWKIEVIDFQKGEDEDKALHKEILSMAKNIKPIYLDKFENSTASVVLGMRLHSIISAVMTHTPFIAINYAPKIKAFLEYMDLSENMLEMKEVTNKNLQKKLKSVEKSIQKTNLRNFSTKDFRIPF